jgi:eukaryotic-like serine/threonine-protein kinase
VKLASGVRLGPYEIVAPIGAGGMGEVYRARDTRLDRTVAIKILPDEFANDARLRARFEREGKAISSLNHPHICALLDVGPDYLVMEHCEGKTLAKRIAEGPLPIGQVVQYGMEMADALDKAHRQGIIHRDLKPANVVLTKSGVKLLDFGLAKQHVESSPAESTVQQVTEEGKILGTIQYMAPELFAGKEADARSDIFALGLLLYEMTTGKPAFSAASKASLIAAILEHEPQPITAPAPLDRLIRACLAKDPEERIQTAHDVKLQLKWTGESDGVIAETRRPRRTLVVAGLAAMALAGALAGFILGRSSKTAAQQPLQHYAIPLPANASIAFVEETSLAVSPAGNLVVYVADTEPPQLYLRSSDDFGTRAVPGTEGARNPFFSPDGKWVGFEADSFLKKVSLAGGKPMTICAGHFTRGADWGSDDQIVFAQNWCSLQRVSASGGKPEPVTPYATNRNERWPIILPGGKHVLYTLGDRSANYDHAKIMVVSLQDGRSRVVLDAATNAHYIPGGHLLYLHSGTLLSIAFDPATLNVSGSPAPVVEEVGSYGPGGLAYAAVSSDGTLLYMPRNPVGLQSELVWVDRKGVPTPITPKRRGFYQPRLSPDGKQLLVAILGKQDRTDLWLCDLGSEAWTRLTSEGQYNSDECWSPDGRQITFSSNRNGPFNVFLMPTDASAPARQLTRNQAWTDATSWSPDGQTLLASWERPGTGYDIMSVPIKEPDHTFAFIATSAQETGGVFSPDGRWVAFQSNESGSSEIYLQAYPRGRRWQISSQGGAAPLWRRDGGELFYRAGSKVMAVPLQLAPDLVIGKPHMLFEGDFDEDYDVSADGQRFVMLKYDKSSSQTQINVVMGLFGRADR